MSKKKNTVSDLLAAINRQPTKIVLPEPETKKPMEMHPERAMPAKQKTSKSAESEKKATSRVGKAVQFWMHDEDRKLVRELSAWLAGQGLRPTDSMVIRAALRQAKTGSALIEAYWDAAKLDGRIKRE